MTAAITAQTNPQRHFRIVSSTVTSESVAGVNPIDTTVVTLRNVRGKVKITITATDDPTGTFALFHVRGGYGQYPSDYTWNWFADVLTPEWCSVTQSVPNIVNVTTTAPLVVRTYTFMFFPGLQYPPTVTRSGGVVLGAADVSFNLYKIN